MPVTALGYLAMSYKGEPKAGEYACFIAKNNKARDYGVLARDFTRLDNHGTCIMHGAGTVGVAGRMRTFSAQELHVAWVRMNNRDNTSADKKALPAKELKVMYLTAIADKELFEKELRNCEEQYVRDQVAAHLAKVQAANEGKQQQQGEKATRKKAPAKNSKRKKKAMPLLVSVQKIPNGTKVAGWFTNAEIYQMSKVEDVQRLEVAWKRKHAQNSVMLLKGWAKDGDMFEGRIVSYRSTKQLGERYHCKFETPSGQVLPLLETDVRNMMKDHEDIFGASSESDGLSTSDEDADDPSLDMDTMVLFPDPTLTRNGNKSVMTDYVGTITRIRISQLTKQFYCTFPESPVNSAWYSPKDTGKMAKAYVRQHFDLETAPTTATVAKCRGPIQRKAVQEACEVTGRTFGTPKFITMPETQSSQTSQTYETMHSITDDRLDEKHADSECKTSVTKDNPHINIVPERTEGTNTVTTFLSNNDSHYILHYIGVNKNDAPTVANEFEGIPANDGDTVEATEGVGMESSKPTSEGAATDNGNTSVTNEDPHINNVPEPIEGKTPMTNLFSNKRE